MLGGHLLGQMKIVQDGLENFFKYSDLEEKAYKDVWSLFLQGKSQLILELDYQTEKHPLYWVYQGQEGFRYEKREAVFVRLLPFVRKTLLIDL